LGVRKRSFESLSESSELVTSGALLLFIVSQRRFRNLLGIFDGDISTYMTSGSEIRAVTACCSDPGSSNMAKLLRLPLPLLRPRPSRSSSAHLWLAHLMLIPW
jgi:hypothetical protein